MRRPKVKALFAGWWLVAACSVVCTVAYAQQDAVPVAPAVPAASAATGMPEPQPNETNAQRARSQPGNNAPFWRGVHDSGKTPGSVNNLQLGERGRARARHRPARRGDKSATTGSFRTAARCW